MPKCHISSCEVTDNVHLYACMGPCHRKFHAACIGVQRNCEESIKHFMLPVCFDCQGFIREQMDMTKLASHQSVILEQLQLQCSSHERLSSQIAKFSCLDTLVDGIDTLASQLAGINSELAVLKKMESNNSVLINELSITCNEDNRTLKADVDNAVSKIMSVCQTSADLLPDFDSLKMEIADQQQSCIIQLEQELQPSLQSIALEINALRSTVCHSNTNVDLIDELRLIHDAVRPKMVDPTPELGTSLASEIAAAQLTKPEVRRVGSAENLTEGWRWLGTKLHWKSKQEWEKYDERKKKRAAQVKEAEKARRKKKSHQRMMHQNKNAKRTQHSAHTSDKDLLAAAKIAFSGNPTPRPDLTFINFQRGETLNPSAALSTVTLPKTASSPITSGCGIMTPAYSPTSSFVTCCHNSPISTCRSTSGLYLPFDESAFRQTRRAPI